MVTYTFNMTKGAGNSQNIIFGGETPGDVFEIDNVKIARI